MSYSFNPECKLHYEMWKKAVKNNYSTNTVQNNSFGVLVFCLNVSVFGLNPTNTSPSVKYEGIDL